MICSNCGKEISKTDKNCNSCGAKNEYYDENTINFQAIKYTKINDKTTRKNQNENPTLATCAIVFSIFYPYIGFILGLIGIFTYYDPYQRHRCKNAVIISTVITLIIVLIVSLILLYLYNN